MRARWVLTLLAAAVAAVGLAQENAPVSGKWNLHLSIAGYESDLACTFTQTGGDVTGECKGEQGSVSITGKVDNKDVTMQHKSEYNGDELTLIYKGKLESSSKIVGAVTVQPMGVDGEFTATQSK